MREYHPRAKYDVLGRVKSQSVPTEVSVSGGTWTPAGDDSVWRWTHQKYDWMGRVVRKIATDGIDQTTLNDSDILISYEGCGLRRRAGNDGRGRKHNRDRLSGQ